MFCSYNPWSQRKAAADKCFFQKKGMLQFEKVQFLAFGEAEC